MSALTFQAASSLPGSSLWSLLTAVESSDGVVAHLREFNPDAIFAAHAASYRVRTPYTLALLLWVAVPTVQMQVGRILGSLGSGASAETGDEGAIKH